MNTQYIDSQATLHTCQLKQTTASHREHKYEFSPDETAMGELAGCAMSSCMS